MIRSVVRTLALTGVAALVPIVAAAQSSQPSAAQPPLRLTVPPIIVTAQKEPVDVQQLPVSVTAVASETIDRAGLSTVSDAAIYAPNTYFSEFTARKLSVARFRGIGSSPANPGITTYIDGVPQLNTSSSSSEFLDVDQVEFVRGAQSALFGRNTLGGLVNITSVRPSLNKWTGHVRVPFGNFHSSDVRASVSGPLSERLAVGLAIGRGQRDGFTTNDVTGHDLDFRAATSAKVQLLWTPTGNWEARAIVSSERAHDGDYALNDLGALRKNPFHAARDFEGYTDRDISSATVLVRREGARLAFSTTTGVVGWKTHDLTDLDYTALPLATRDNAEKDTQISQEVRLASAPNAPVRLGDGAVVKWQTGVVLFSQKYTQDAVNAYAPYLLSPDLPFAISQHLPKSALDDFGAGVYGQGTVTLGETLDVSVGARVDYENKNANLSTFFSPVIAPGTSVITDRSFSDVSPKFAMAYRFRPERMAYASVARGFKAGGFNPSSPPNSEAYGEEHAWHVEGGMKTSWVNGRVLANAAVFNIDWQDLQLNLPNPAAPGQFYIANVGAARSSGVEFEVNAQPHPSVGLFSTLGYTHARFKTGSISSGVNVSDNELPGTPDYTAAVGAQYTRPIGSAATLFGRGEAVFYGAFQYDDANSDGQEAYALANFRLGVERKRVMVEGWVRNAFDTRYIPIALPYPGFAPSGFIGESGRPRTFGISVGFTF